MNKSLISAHISQKRGDPKDTWTDTKRVTTTRKQCRAISWLLAFSIGLTTLMVAELAVGAPATQPAQYDFEELLTSADSLAMSEQHKKAFVAYERALAAMPPELRIDVAGLVVVAAAESALAQHRIHGESELLIRAHAMIRRYLEDADKKATVPEDVLTPVRSVLAQIEDKLPPSKAEPQPTQQIGQPHTEDQVAPDQAPNSDASDTAPSSIDLYQPPPPKKATLSPKRLANPRPQDTRRFREASSQNRPAHLLITTGGLLDGVGVGLVIAGSRQLPWFEREMRQLGWVTAHPSYESELTRAKRVRNIDIALGSGLSVVGSALIITGLLLLRRRAKRTASMAALDRWQLRPTRRLTNALGSAPVNLKP